MRTATVSRETKETKVRVELNLDGTGVSKISTGVGFFDHMLTLFAKHGFMDLTVEAEGDLETGSHHTIEDCGLALGQALRQAIGNKEGINRYGSMLMPMDESLVQVVVDFSGRPYLVFFADLPKCVVGGMETEMVEEFFRAVAMEAGLTLHISTVAGGNLHHTVEAMFKGAGRALCESVALNPRVVGVMSTKGTL